MAATVQPPNERITPEMALDDEVGASARSEPVEPADQDLVERSLPDPDRRIRQDAIETQVGGYVGGRSDSHPVRHAGGFGVVGGQRASPLVDVDRPHPSVRRPSSGDAGDRPPAAAEVEHDSVVGLDRRSLEQEEFRAGVESVSSEDTAVARELQREVGEDDVDRSG